MFDGQASLAYDNDNSTHASKEQKDNSDSDCTNESRNPDAAHADFAKYGLALTKEGLVHWKEGGTHHPRNWNINRKLYDSFLVILFEFIA
jgi:hypothetical protein